MRRTWSLVALLVIASGSLGCQQLGRRSSCGAPPDCGCTAASDACHCGSGQPACGTNGVATGEMIPAAPSAAQHPAGAPYEEVPQKPPMTAPPPPPPESAQAPRPLELLLQ